MPQVRCPDCFQDMTVTHEQMSRVIQCTVCEAKIGPLVSPPPGAPPVPPPPPAPQPEFEKDRLGESAAKPRTKGKRLRQKSTIRFLPILLGITVGLGGTAALLGAMYVLITSQAVPRSTETIPPLKSDVPANALPAKPTSTRPH